MNFSKRKHFVVPWGMMALFALVLMVPQTASAKYICMNFGNAGLVGTKASIPKANSCSPFTGFIAGQGGNVLTGTICTSMDNSTVLVHLLPGLYGPETLEAQLSRSSLSSTNGSDCVVSACYTDLSVAVVACNPSKPPVPASTAQPATGASTVAP
ncbi:MAG: hypothetical protein ACREQI_08270 [Candidatus Binataceae bacterium]